MTDKEVDKLLVMMERYSKELKEDPKKSREFLVGAGILNKNGKLTKHYKNLCIPQEQA